MFNLTYNRREWELMSESRLGNKRNWIETDLKSDKYYDPQKFWGTATKHGMWLWRSEFLRVTATHQTFGGVQPQAYDYTFARSLHCHSFPSFSKYRPPHACLSVVLRQTQNAAPVHKEIKFSNQGRATILQGVTASMSSQMYTWTQGQVQLCARLVDSVAF